MRILVLGISGLLGHQVYRIFCNLNHEVIGTMRQPFSEFKYFSFFSSDNIIDEVDFFDILKIEKIIKETKPDAIINCVGLTHHVSKDPYDMIFVNSLMPHKIAYICDKIKSLYVQISTDCVFSGEKGYYSEEDIADAISLYGRSKILGEVNYNHLTIRTSFIGRELKTKHGLLEWILLQKGIIKGYSNVLWNGITSNELARIINYMIMKDARGLYHVGSEEIINKFYLLQQINTIFNKDLIVEKNYSVINNKSLNISKYREMGIESKKIEILLEEIKNERH